jgi:hypothetical protein
MNAPSWVDHHGQIVLFIYYEIAEILQSAYRDLLEYQTYSPQTSSFFNRGAEVDRHFSWVEANHDSKYQMCIS